MIDSIASEGPVESKTGRSMRLTSLAHLNACITTLASTPFERDQALELRDYVYRKKGLITHSTMVTPLAPAALSPGSAIFLAKRDYLSVGTISFLVDSAVGLPIDAVHAYEVNEIRKRQATIAEISSLAVAEESRGGCVTLLLFREIFRWAMAAGIRYLVAAVNPSTKRVYERLLSFQTLGTPRKYKSLSDAPSIPLLLDLDRAFSQTAEHARSFPLSRDNLIHFFCDSDHQCYPGFPNSARYLQWTPTEIRQLITQGRITLTNEITQLLAVHYADALSPSLSLQLEDLQSH